MGLDEYLLPGEEIRFQSPGEIEYGNCRYTLYLTNKRLILYKQSGFFIFKKDHIVTEKLSDIESLRYREEGFLLKKGVIEVVTKTRKIFLRGDAHSMKALFQSLQELIGKE